MLDKEAISHLQSIVVAAAGASLETTDNGYLMVPPGFQAVDLDRFNDNPSYFREQFKTDHIPSFIEYLATHGDAPCYIDKKGMCAKVIFDAGDFDAPGHRFHQATLDLARSPMYASVNAMTSSKKHSQRELAEWLEDWRTHLTAETSTGDEIDLRKVINGVRNFSVRAKAGADHSQESLSASKSAFAQIEAGDKDHIPEYLIAHGAPFFGLQDFDIPMRLSIRLSTDGEPPTFALFIVQPDRLINEIAEAFAETIRNSVDDDSRVLIGTV